MMQQPYAASVHDNTVIILLIQNEELKLKYILIVIEFFCLKASYGK